MVQNKSNVTHLTEGRLYKIEHSGASSDFTLQGKRGKFVSGGSSATRSGTSVGQEIAPPLGVGPRSSRRVRRRRVGGWRLDTPGTPRRESHPNRAGFAQFDSVH